MAIGSTIPLVVVQKIVPRILNKMGDLQKLSTALQTKCNNLPLNIKCNDPRITDIKKLLDRIQKLIKSLKLLKDSLNKIIKTLNNVAKAATVVKLIQLQIPPGGPPGIVAEVLIIVNALLQNVKSALDCFIELIDIINLHVSNSNDSMAQTLMVLGSVCNSESFTVTSDVKTLLDDRAANTATSATSTTNNGDSLITDSNSTFYYTPVAADDDISDYIELLNTIAQDIEDPTKAVNYLDEAPTLVYSGNGMPIATTGKNGDYYIDLANSTVYGPKPTDISWQ